MEKSFAMEALELDDTFPGGHKIRTLAVRQTQIASQSPPVSRAARLPSRGFSSISAFLASQNSSNICPTAEIADFHRKFR
jgi:hypothetical protein